jgi:hypothetical protein
LALYRRARRALLYTWRDALGVPLNMMDPSPLCLRNVRNQRFPARRKAVIRLQHYALALLHWMWGGGGDSVKGFPDGSGV